MRRVMPCSATANVSGSIVTSAETFSIRHLTSVTYLHYGVIDSWKALPIRTSNILARPSRGCTRPAQTLPLFTTPERG